MSRTEEEDDNEDDAEVMIAKRDRGSVSRLMIQEFMILAGEIAGKLGAIHHIIRRLNGTLFCLFPAVFQVFDMPCLCLTAVKRAPFCPSQAN